MPLNGCGAVVSWCFAPRRSSRLLEQNFTYPTAQIGGATSEGLPRAYTKDLYQSKCDALFQHVYESYYGDGGSVYAGHRA